MALRRWACLEVGQVSLSQRPQLHAIDITRAPCIQLLDIELLHTYNVFTPEIINYFDASLFNHQLNQNYTPHSSLSHAGIHVMVT